MELTVSAEGGVLSNDEDVDDHRIAASVVWEPENGTLSLKEDGSFTYNPCTDFHGDDFFAYEVSDTKGSTATATTKITVRPDNDQPTALPATGLLPFHGTILIPNTDEQFLSVMPSGATSGS
jgi:VCBS repeat-containing protein